MSEYTVIGDVGRTLTELLWNNMRDLLDNQSEIALFNPGDTSNINIRLMLFLYAIRENEHMKNRTLNNQDIAHETRNPLSLDLYYMLTPYPSSDSDLTSRTINAHWILGRAMQILHDNPVLKGSILRGNLAGTNEELRVVQTALSIEDVSQIWNTFKDTFYRLSVFYLVTPVNIDSTHEKELKRVVKKILDKNQIKTNNGS